MLRVDRVVVRFSTSRRNRARASGESAAKDFSARARALCAARRYILYVHGFSCQVVWTRGEEGGGGGDEDGCPM